VECTPAYLGRDPLLLEMLSEKSGLHLLTNTGYYGAINNKFIPQHAFTETADQLSGRWTDEWINGIEDTDIKPGFIKISVARDAELSDLHEKLVKAAARTHLKTGLTIASHTGPAAPAYAQLDILKSEGVHPSAFIWVHAQRGDSTSHVRMAQQGAWISLHNVKSNPQNIERYTRMLLNMKQYNLLDRVLISHDAGWYKPGQPNGGQFRGYEAVFNDLVPSLENAGFSPREINQIMRQNPARAFRVQIRKID
jgi:phosphotriesterase-related protein